MAYIAPRSLEESGHIKHYIIYTTSEHTTFKIRRTCFSTSNSKVAVL